MFRVCTANASRRWLFTRVESACFSSYHNSGRTETNIANILTKLIPQSAYDFPGETKPTSVDRITDRMKRYSPFVVYQNDFSRYSHILCFDDFSATNLERAQASAYKAAGGRGKIGRIVQLKCPYKHWPALDFAYEQTTQTLLASIKAAINEFCSLYMGPSSMDPLLYHQPPLSNYSSSDSSRGKELYLTKQCVLPPGHPRSQQQWEEQSNCMVRVADYNYDGLDQLGTLVSIIGPTDEDVLARAEGLVWAR